MRIRRARRTGATLAWLLGLMAVWAALLGLAVDTGWGVLVGGQLQNAADAAALAGAQPLKAGRDQVRTVAMMVAARNPAAGHELSLDANPLNAPGGDVVVGRYNRSLDLFTPTDSGGNAVRVVTRRTGDSADGPVPLFFGPMFGVDSIEMSRSAIARNLGGTGAGLVALCPDCTCALEVTDGALHVLDGVIQIDAAVGCAMCGGGSVTSVGVDIAAGGGECTGDGAADGHQIDTMAVPLGDPVADVPEPDWEGLADLGAITTSGLYGPGYYSGGLDLQTGIVFLQTGTYVLGGVGLRVGPSGVVIANRCMMYIPPGGGAVDLTDVGGFRLTPPASGPYEGISIFQSRLNTNAAAIHAGGGMLMTGTGYFPAAQLTLGGSGATAGNQHIAWTIRVEDAGTLTIRYLQSFPPDEDAVYLVE